MKEYLHVHVHVRRFDVFLPSAHGCFLKALQNYLTATDLKFAVIWNEQYP